MAPGDLFAAQRGHLFLWVPVALACGIGIYFQLPWEPGSRHLMIFTGLALFLLTLGIWARSVAPVFCAIGFVLLGVVLISVRAQTVAAPVLEYRTYSLVEGRLIGVDRSLSDAPRLTLDNVIIAKLSGPMPAKLRVSLHGPLPSQPLLAGMRIRLTANLSPPSGPVEPGGFDFQRHAWFDRLGGVGYVRGEVEILPDKADSLPVAKQRQALSSYLHKQLPGETGAFAAAILAGDRSGISRERLDNLRDSNLAHLLAISGLHMGLLTGFVFALTRAGFALWPAFGLRVNSKKIAALVALIAAAGYLALSGANVATQRAFVMVAVMLLAVLLDRRAVTLRSVAIAALIILFLEPESLVEPGFQMSFAATTALVAVFGALQDWPDHWPQSPKWARPILGTVISSAVAGAATAPFAAAHFNQVAQFGLLANLLAVPLMGILVIPSAVLGLGLAPLGLGKVGFTLMGWGIEWILYVAQWVSSLEGAIWPVTTPNVAVLPLIALGGLFVIIWRGALRLAGFIPCAIAVGLWGISDRPIMLIADTASLYGVMTPSGRALSKAKGDGFSARSWLENDGDAGNPVIAHARLDWGPDPNWVQTEVLGKSVVLLKGRGWRERLDPACQQADWLIVPQWIRDRPNGKCSLLDRRTLARTGAIAVYDNNGKPRFVRANEGRAGRPWAQ
ncbi:ComEC/Rec2 family competence protein [Actibacterium pelagium]|uniref:Competence protein ComEC n=1 Tax=Actibacterium pelagium TaxID=2029103 RepID=A0A917AE08_9RHOB|nr:ComEC/Rec2 family competence protein [Actibacterium pelagium]GGE41726.1 hypothetical protein GCM10011517_06670 [Actibacterium pelagium]